LWLWWVLAVHIVYIYVSTIKKRREKNLKNVPQPKRSSSSLGPFLDSLVGRCLSPVYVPAAAVAGVGVGGVWWPFVVVVVVPVPYT
jgi:hypothetical protein